MKVSKLISVIMPAYNAEKFIGESIDSVIAQTYTNWELIVVDDGSADSTKDIVYKYAEKDERISYIYQNNGRQGKARNTGIYYARGQLIAFLDADDVWMPDKLSVQLQLADETGCSLVFSDAHFINDAAQVIIKDHFLKKEIFKGLDGLKAFLITNPICTSSVMVKREELLTAGNFKTDNSIQFGEDYDLWLRLMLQGVTMTSCPQPLLYYRVHSSQSTKVSNAKDLQVIKIIASLPSNSGYNQEKDKAIRVWFRRSLKNAQLTKDALVKILNFFPRKNIKRVMHLALFSLPFAISKKIIYRLSFY